MPQSLLGSVVRVRSFTSQNRDRPQVHLPVQLTSEAEELELKFKTTQKSGPLIYAGLSADLRLHRAPRQHFGLIMVDGRLRYVVQYSKRDGVLEYDVELQDDSRGLHDSKWHLVKIRRSAHRVAAYLDGEWQILSKKGSAYYVAD